jgi:hypothetical protein
VYIVLIGLLYIMLMMLITAESAFKAGLVIVFGGGFIAVLFYLMDTPRRRRARSMRELAEERDHANTGQD